MDSLEKLQNIFERFPGIGPRQASRFVHFLLRSSPALRRELASEIQKLGGTVKQCTLCRRFFAGTGTSCAICTNSRRDDSLLLVVAADSDVDTIENSATYTGRYFVLGGLISLGSDKVAIPNEKSFLERVKNSAKDGSVREIILALPANPEGDATEEYIRSHVEQLVTGSDTKITVLGRGLSTGSEIEYADPETIKNALANRR